MAQSMQMNTNGGKIKTEENELIGWIVDVPGWYIFESELNSQP